MNEIFIRLSDIDLRILKRAENATGKKYIEGLEGIEYITPYELFSCIDDLEDSYSYSEQQISELTNAINEKHEDNIPGLEKSLQNEVNRLKKENEDLKEENEILRNNALFYCNEDMLDRLAFEGVEL